MLNVKNESRIALLALLIPIFAAVTVSAKPLSRIPMWQEPATEDLHAGERADTLFLFAASGPGSFGSEGTTSRGYSFDAADGSPTHAGWSGLDLNEPDGDWWHVAEASLTTGHLTDMSAALPFDAQDLVNDYSLWCGAEDQCGWVNPRGYGNDWAQGAVVDLADVALADSLVLDFGLATWYEGSDYDNLTLLLRFTNGQEQELHQFQEVFGLPYSEQNFFLAAADALGDTLSSLVFHFSSDGGWSDEDGRIDSDIGAVWLDNIRVSVDGAIRFETDFEDGQMPAGLSTELVPGTGDLSALYSGLPAEDPCFRNDTNYWAFFDTSQTTAEWPDGIVPFGPPYIANYIRSPLLQRDQHGQPLSLGPDQRFILSADIYMDLPLENLVFFHFAIGGATGVDPTCFRYAAHNAVWYGEQKEWSHFDLDVTHLVVDVVDGDWAGTETLYADMGVVDMCEVWCNTVGDGVDHHSTPYIDNLSLAIVDGGPAAWLSQDYHNFQDAFPEPAGTVRMDNADDLVRFWDYSTPVPGDSAVVYLKMEPLGGMAETWNGDAGEMRPDLHLYWRVIDGPHTGSLDPAMADPDDLDGVWSPWAGTQVLGSDTWCTMQADLAKDDGVPMTDRYAFDFNDDYFLPGDRIEYFYRAASQTGAVISQPTSALDGAHGPPVYHHVRCLPTPGNDILLVEDGSNLTDSWRMAFELGGLHTVDVFTTLQPGQDLANGLGVKAELADLAGYRVIIWDSGTEVRNTLITGGQWNDSANETQLLLDWLDQSQQNAGLWVMGDLLAQDIDDGSGYLGSMFGAQVDHGDSYRDLTGIAAPVVSGIHPALQYLGGAPEFFAFGGCPQNRDFAAVSARQELMVSVSHAWQDDAGLGLVAGILDLDPEDDGFLDNSQGYTTRALFSPFSYSAVRDNGYAVPEGVSYARYFPLHVLEQLFGYAGGGYVPAETLPVLATKLDAAFPNPFNPSTTLAFTLAESGPMRLSIHDVTGRELVVLAEGRHDAGRHALTWDGRDAAGHTQASGVYFADFRAGDHRDRRKLLLLK